jgi:hypothetical protein
MSNKIQLKRLEDYPGYFVSNTGRVYSNIQPHRTFLNGGVPYEIQPKPHNRGYWEVGLFITENHGKKIRKWRRVHQLVAETFIGPKPGKGYEVNHKDGNKKNNNLDNLEWCTRSQNIKHSFNIGLRNQKNTAVIFDGNRYESIKDCATQLHINYHSLLTYLHRRAELYKGKELRYADK